MTETMQGTESTPSAEKRWVLVCHRFDQVLKRHPVTEKALTFKRHRRGDIVTGLEEHDVVRLLKARAIAPEGSALPAAPTSDSIRDQIAATKLPVEIEGVTGGDGDVGESAQIPAEGDPPAAAPAPPAAPADAERPAPTAPTKDWVAYAVSRSGMDPAAAAKLSREELIKQTAEK